MNTKKLVGTKYVQHPDFIYRKIVDEIILVPIHQDIADLDSIFSLNKIGAFLWENLEQPKSKSELAQAILEEYDVNQNTAQQDLDSFIDAMLNFGALQEVG